MIRRSILRQVVLLIKSSRAIISLLLPKAMELDCSCLLLSSIYSLMLVALTLLIPDHLAPPLLLHLLLLKSNLKYFISPSLSPFLTLDFPLGTYFSALSHMLVETPSILQASFLFSC